MGEPHMCQAHGTFKIGIFMLINLDVIGSSSKICPWSEITMAFIAQKSPRQAKIANKPHPK
eukprot:581917-Pleurochrysis_carterae.AAC.1